MKDISTRFLIKIGLTVLSLFLIIHYWENLAGFTGVYKMKIFIIFCKYSFLPHNCPSTT